MIKMKKGTLLLILIISIIGNNYLFYGDMVGATTSQATISFENTSSIEVNSKIIPDGSVAFKTKQTQRVLPKTSEEDSPFFEEIGLIIVFICLLTKRKMKRKIGKIYYENEPFIYR